MLTSALLLDQVVRYGPVDSALLVAEGHQELVSSPDWTQSMEWASYSLLLGSGLAMYPHALQRVYNSSTHSLRYPHCLTDDLTRYEQVNDVRMYGRCLRLRVLLP